MPSENHVCESVADILAEYDEIESPAKSVRGHLGECLRCQAELSGFRRLRRSMRELSECPETVDPSFRHEILFALDRVDDQAGRMARVTAVTIGGLAAAAGVIVVASRQIRSTRMAG